MKIIFTMLYLKSFSTVKKGIFMQFDATVLLYIHFARQTTSIVAVYKQLTHVFLITFY